MSRTASSEEEENKLDEKSSFNAFRFIFVSKRKGVGKAGYKATWIPHNANDVVQGWK